MELAVVQGSVVATIKTERLKGHKLLILNITGPDTKPTNTFVVAVDTVGAGVGEMVLIARGSSARQTADLATVPTDASIIAIVDAIEWDGRMVFQKEINKPS
jgi:microcompartment protein CcmK/EutM